MKFRVQNPTIKLLQVVLITGADHAEGIDLVRELCKRGAERVIMAVTNLDLAQDIALEVRAELNADVIAEYCDMTSLRSVRNFCTKILESETRLHILINHATVMWCPLRRTAEGHEWHWGVNHLAHFVVTQLVMPLLLRGTPDARVITLSSSWHSRGKIFWNNPDYLDIPTNVKSGSLQENTESRIYVTPSSPEESTTSKSQDHALQEDNKNIVKSHVSPNYKAHEAFNQSKLANVLFTRELSRRMEGTGVNT